MKKPWLRDWPWESVVTINSALDKEERTLPKPSTQGYESARKLWEGSRSAELPLRQALEICRGCHKLSPFRFYNGNTFAAIGRTMIQGMLRKLPPVKAQALRSMVGHYIAGIADEDDLDQVLAELD
jgi:hypothetical protein